MKRNIFLYAVLSLFTVTTATGCDERSDNPMPDNAIRVETAEVTAITSDNAISGGRIIGETQASVGRQPTIRPSPITTI